MEEEKCLQEGDKNGLVDSTVPATRRISKQLRNNKFSNKWQRHHYNFTTKVTNDDLRGSISSPSDLVRLWFVSENYFIY